MIIFDAKVYDLEESIDASGFPMRDAATPPTHGANSNDERRARTLAQTPIGSGHDNFMCGIVVNFSIIAPRYFFAEFQRYHHAEIVSSTSTMHKLRAIVEEASRMLDRGDLELYDKYISSHFCVVTEPRVICEFFNFAMKWLKDGAEDMDVLKANLPEGWYQKARISTNYRQLKTIYSQRRSHRLGEWQFFCDWIETLPHSELIVGEAEQSQAKPIKAEQSQEKTSKTEHKTRKKEAKNEH